MSIQIRTDRDAWRMVPVGEIQPYERNAKIHGPEQLRLLRRSLRESGFVRPLLVDEELRLIAGHGVLEAARAEGMERVPCVVVTGLTEAQRRAYILADNKLSELSAWDEGVLALELPELEALDVDVSALGFEPLGDADPPAKADGDAAAPEEEPPPPVVSPPLARRGDLWILGPHRVMCGDCTSRGDVEALLGGDRPELLLTDPPYCSGGFQEAGRRAGSVGTDRADRDETMLINDTLSTRGYCAMMRRALELAPCPWAYIFTDWRMWVYLYDVAESSGFGVRNMIVWDKGTPGMGVGWRAQHELILFGERQKFPFDKHLAQGNVIAAARSGNGLHPTQKPVELLRTLLDVMEGARGVLDLFGGSLSTMMACDQAGQPCYSMELSPEFVSTGIRRWAEVHSWADVRCIRDGRELTAGEAGVEI